MKICSFTIFPQFFHFSRSSSQTLISQFFLSQIFSSLNPFVMCETKGHIYLNKPASKTCRLSKNVCLFVTTGYETVKIIRHI